ncbi:metal ABC transporter permease [Candidatus Bathyarchaeota archaeon]|nr:metal ABC transporter permease [Candidatus Bathyarchaeota archaeon]
MLDPFTLRAFISVFFMSLSAPIMVIMLLRGALYITPEISHAALGGAALGVLLQTLFITLIDPFIIVILFCAGVAILTAYVGRSGLQSLSMMMSALLAVSVTIYALIRSWLPKEKRIIVDGYLISDILLLSDIDIINLAVTSIISFLITLVFYKEFIYICFDADTAEALGLRVKLYDALLFATTSIAAAVIVKAVGVLLSVALLILPAAASRILARNINRMFAASLMLVLLSGAIGIALSYQFNIPTSGAIAFTSTIIFALAYLTKLKK